MNKKGLFWGINKPDTKDPEEMNVLEQKHVPVLSAPDTVKKGEIVEVKVEVGKYHDHPNEHQHFIQWVKLRLGENQLAQSYFISEKGVPVVTFTVKIPHSGTLYALEHCTLHGTWTSFKKEITVVV